MITEDNNVSHVPNKEFKKKSLKSKSQSSFNWIEFEHALLKLEET